MGRYLDRLKKSENSGAPYLQNLQNPAPPSFVGFVGTPSPTSQKNETPKASRGAPPTIGDTKEAPAAVHGAGLVDGLADQSPKQDERPTPEAPKGTNGYGVVVTAQIRPPTWHRARDAYHSHLMTCPTCKPSVLCSDGRQLQVEYTLLTDNRPCG